MPHRFPPFLIYLLGDEGPAMGRNVFEFVMNEEIGDVFVVTNDAPALGCPFAGALHQRNCTTVRRQIPRSIKKEGVSNHYASRYCMEKMDLVHLLPLEVRTVVLLDADIFCVRGCAARFRDELAAFNTEQFVAAPRADPRILLRSSSPSKATRSTAAVSSPKRAQNLTIPSRSEGINSGVLLIDVVRMRMFEEAFCPGERWWRCVLRAAPMGYHGAGGDQAVWNQLLVDHPASWRQLPCGMHTSVAVLHGVVRSVALSLGEPLCNLSSLRAGAPPPPSQQPPRSTHLASPLRRHPAHIIPTSSPIRVVPA